MALPLTAAHRRSVIIAFTTVVCQRLYKTRLVALRPASHIADCVLFHGYWPRGQLHVFQNSVYAMVDNQGTCGWFRCQTDERDTIRIDFSIQEQGVTLLWKCNPTSLFFPSPQSQRYVGNAGS
jgi:hypothetical protein